MEALKKTSRTALGALSVGKVKEGGVASDAYQYRQVGEADHDFAQIETVLRGTKHDCPPDLRGPTALRPKLC
jgi:hypothetical protein